MTDTDMIEAMKIAIGPHFIGNRMPDMSGDPLRRATPYERRRIDEAVTAALAVVQPELDRLRAENVELSHREKVRSEAINRDLTCQRELAEEARSVADLANKLFDQRDEYLSGLTARNAELSAENARLRSVGTDALTVLKFAFNRIHVLPRSRDTELANDIDKVLGSLRAALSAPALDGEGR